MPWNGAGTYSLPPAYSPEVNGDVIDAVRYNGLTTDIATGVTNALAKDGQNTPTANLPMGGFKLTGLAAGTLAGESLRFEQVSLRVAETSLALSATTSDIGAQAAGEILLTGAAVTVTAFPAATVGTMKILRFNGVNTLTHSASFLLPNGSLNITTASEDRAVVVYTSAGWNFISYVKANGQPLQAAAPGLSQITAASAANSISNADFAQAWNWSLTTASKVAFKLSESAASSGSGSTLFQVESLSASTARPVYCNWNGATNGEIGFDTAGGLLVKARAASSGAGQPVAIAGSPASGASSSGGGVTIVGGAAGATAGQGGGVTLTGGASTSTNIGGDITLTPGAGASASLAGRVIAQRTLILATSETPSISSGAGSGATIYGNNNSFAITIGTSAGTTIVVNFTRNLSGSSSSYPISIAQLNRNTIQCNATCSQSSCTIVLASAPTSGDILQVHVFPVSSSTV